MVKNLPTSAGDARNAGLIRGSGRFSGVEYGNPFQYSCLENSMDRGELVGYNAWGLRVRHYWATDTFTFFTYICSVLFFPTEHTYSHILPKLLIGKIECSSLQMLPTCKLLFCFLSQCFILLIKRIKGTFFSSHNVYLNCIYLASVASFMLICLIYKEPGNCSSTTYMVYGSSGAEVGVSG